MNTTGLGRQAEDFTADFLAKEFGWILLHKNWRTRTCEIDLVMQEGATIHFIEVKFRRNNFAGGGIAAINSLKLKRMASAALEWLEQNGSEDLQPNLAAVEVLLGAHGQLEIGSLIESIQT